MNRCRIGRGLISTLAIAAIIASCGGSDGAGGDGAAPDLTVDEASTDSPTDEATSDDAAADVESDAESDDDSNDDSDSGSTVNCDAIFSMAEMEEFFAEPVELTEETNDDIGQLVCTWESIEDPDNLEDLAAQSLLVQFYSGSPIDASAFFDLELYESPTPIDGIGDLAYATGTAGMDYFFVDEPVGGSLNYITFDMGAEDSVPMHTPDDVEQLFRTFHDRVT